MRDLSGFIANAEFLPPVPHVMTKVNAFLKDPNSTIADFESVISQDQVISTKLLRLVNSSFYAFNTNVDTVGKAITMVGYKKFSDIVVGLSITQMFKKAPTMSFDLKAFWKHSLACGVAARVLAMYEGADDIEAYFTAGLLHDIGRMFFIFNDSANYAEIMKKTTSDSIPAHILEKEHYGFDHAELGGHLTKVWKFPKNLQEAVRCHHAPGLSDLSDTLTATIHLANLMVHACQIGESGDYLIPGFDKEAWNRVGLNAAILTPASERVFKQFRELEETILR